MKKFDRVCVFFGSLARYRDRPSVKVVFLDALQILSLPVGRAPQSADFVLVTSKNAVRPARDLRSKLWVCIGAETARAVRRLRPRQLVSLRQSDSAGVVAYFRRQKARGLIYFPRSARGDPELPKALRRLGYRVVVRHAYQTRVVSVRHKLLKILRAHGTARIFICLTSPSTALAYKKSLPPSLRAARGPVVSLGPTTSAALRRFKIPSWEVQPPRSIDSVLAQILRRKIP